MDDRIYKLKEDLIEQAKQLSENENLAEAFAKMRSLKRKWRTTEDPEEESLYDKKLADTFNEYIDKISAKETEAFASIEEFKKNIIKEAKDLLNESNIKKASNTMNELMEKWKDAGRCNKEIDDALWEQFREIRNQFFDKRNTYYDELKKSFAENKELKEKLIEDITKANEITDIKELTNKINELMTNWKNVGSAGRKTDNELWDKFNEQRKIFYKKRKEYTDSLKEVFEKRTAAKKEIIQEAKLNLARSEFTDEEYETMKNLRAKWKEIGNAGRNNEEDLWHQFQEIMNKYFENAKFYRDK